MAKPIRHIDLSYDITKSDETATALVTALFPDWAASPSKIEFIRFKDGITNTVCIPLSRPWTEQVTDQDCA